MIDEYLNLAQLGRWEEALTLIEEIVSRDKNSWTNWFNYGVCLEGLMLYSDSSNAFKKAYNLKRSDKGIQYRVFRSIAQSGNIVDFMDFIKLEVGETPQLFDLLEKHEEFLEMTQTPEYQNFKKNYS